MQYLISSPPTPNLDKLLEYAKTLGIDVMPLPAPTKKRSFGFENLISKAQSLDWNELNKEMPDVEMSEDEIMQEINAYRDERKHHL